METQPPAEDDLLYAFITALTREVWHVGNIEFTSGRTSNLTHEFKGEGSLFPLRVFCDVKEEEVEESKEEKEEIEEKDEVDIGNEHQQLRRTTMLWFVYNKSSAVHFTTDRKFQFMENKIHSPLETLSAFFQLNDGTWTIERCNPPMVNAMAWKINYATYSVDEDQLARQGFAEVTSLDDLFIDGSSHRLKLYKAAGVNDSRNLRCLAYMFVFPTDAAPRQYGTMMLDGVPIKLSYFVKYVCVGIVLEPNTERASIFA